MKHLTVRQPWAGLIALGVKDVENRTWVPSLAPGDRFAIQAGSGFDMTCEVDDSHPLCQVHGLVIATVALVDVVRDSPSDWAAPGKWHWVLERPVRVRDGARIPGRLGLWDPPTS